MEQKEYWNSIADKKEFTTPFDLNEFSNYVKKDMKILDVGCGYGRTLSELYEFGYKNLYGVDFSENMIKRAKANNPNIDFEVNEGDLPYKNDTFDSVILFAVLTCISDNDTQRDLIQEIYRVLKPNGIIYVNDFLLNDDERNINRYNAYRAKYDNYGVFELKEGAVLRHHDVDYIKELLSDYKKLKFERVTFKTMNGHTSNGFYYFGKK
ncbi:class I SAM-dependent methyltransferase [Anaerofustis stercorihominis]|uniref:class I SAM-dependent methyltransferase n=1 Tax=Anaerofustis stercorihominis TaxID=214853 RepID=UPI00210EA431|nr:class I SAM-dependent methyltransferase [Anaerofustis stercorihominis]MCQ4795952.1 class I SAM-dependent methyltransferase [Anaerofustis stercorihominis]